jgi:hypothetical protein
MGLCGITNALVQILLGGRIIRYLGPRRIFIGGFCALALSLSAYPLLSLLAKRAGGIDGAVLTVLVFQLSCSFMLYFAFCESRYSTATLHT